MDAFRPIDVTRVRNGERAEATDRAATEEPLEVRLHGRPFAVIMRTPGADRELAAGFLFSERVFLAADDLGAIEHCRDARRTEQDAVTAGGDAVHPENVVDVTLANGRDAALDELLAQRRLVATNSSG